MPSPMQTVPTATTTTTTTATTPTTTTTTKAKAKYTENVDENENKKDIVSPIYTAYRTYLEPIFNMLEQNANKNIQPVNEINILIEIINYLNIYSYQFSLFANKVFGKFFIFSIFIFLILLIYL